MVWIRDCQYDFDGWIDVNELEKNQLTNELNYKEYIDPNSDFKTMLCRPKTLKGIEDNNGWTKIESEDDLPTDKTTQYSACKDKKIFQSTVNCGTVKHWFNIGKITHYQPIKKQLEPLY